VKEERGSLVLQSMIRQPASKGEGMLVFFECLHYSTRSLPSEKSDETLKSWGSSEDGQAEFLPFGVPLIKTAEHQIVLTVNRKRWPWCRAHDCRKLLAHFVGRREKIFQIRMSPQVGVSTA